jgi:hypothetical protein
MREFICASVVPPFNTAIITVSSKIQDRKINEAAPCHKAVLLLKTYLSHRYICLCRKLICGSLFDGSTNHSSQSKKRNRKNNMPQKRTRSSSFPACLSRKYEPFCKARTYYSAQCHACQELFENLSHFFTPNLHISDIFRQKVTFFPLFCEKPIRFLAF